MDTRKSKQDLSELGCNATLSSRLLMLLRAYCLCGGGQHGFQTTRVLQKYKGCNTDIYTFYSASNVKI